jgi:hypothetical protein
MSIQDSLEKINPVRNREGSQPSISNGVKSFLISQKGKDFLIILIVIFVALSSFGLGRLSKENKVQSLKIEYKDQEASIIGAQELSETEIGQKLAIPQSGLKNSAGEYFASKRGKKYYPIDCSAGKSIKIENRIYFKTSEEAEKAGYELSSSC